MHLQYYRQVEPIAAARPFVRRIIYCDCDEPITLCVPAPPTGYNHVGWALRGAGAKVTDAGTMRVAEGEVHIAGQTVRTAAKVVLQGRVRHILAELSAVGLTACFGLLAEPLVNRVVSATAAGRAGLQATLDRVSPDGDMEEAIVLFQRALVAEYAAAQVPAYVRYAAAGLEESQGLAPLHTVLGGVGERQLQRKFKQVVGCSPKYFGQLLRVNATIVSIVERRQDTLAEIAARHGFTDQPHMVRTIQTYFGHAPSDIRRNVDMPIRTFPTARAPENSRHGNE